MDPEDKKRAPNLSRAEKLALIKEVQKRRQAVFGDANSPDYAERAQAAWKEITDAVNAVNNGRVLRTVKWLRIYWKIIRICFFKSADDVGRVI